jgi:Zn-dependent peptidase ImmA (M78 family)
MDVDEVRGLSKWERGGPPAVLINAADSVAARIFTLMHEYAHLVVSHAERPFVCDPSQAARGVERVANRIAAAALLPKQLIEPLVVAGERDLAYGDWPPGFRASLRRALHVSHPVIGIRLTDLGLAAGPGRTKSFWRAGGGFGLSRLTMGQRYRKYLGARTMSLAAAALADGRLDPAGASRTLGIPTKHFEAALQA